MAPPPLAFVDLGGYHVAHSEITSAFDLGAVKGCRSLGEALAAAPGYTGCFVDPQRAGVEVERGNSLDGLGRHFRDPIARSNGPLARIANSSDHRRNAPIPGRIAERRQS
jgi:myo-inositol-1-phosphate synthase